MITESPADFAASLPDAGRLLGLDVGTKTIGTALCDAGWMIATPASLIRRKDFKVDMAALSDLVRTQSVKGIVMGLPLGMDGKDTPRTQSVRAFARHVEKLDRPLLLWDERWSTMAVERAMIAQDMSRAKRAERIDNAAAAFILEGALAALGRI
jgi:putative Holliday junction resolvase